MTKKSTTQPCLVCGQSSNSILFGAPSCRACGEFFRRKVISNFKIKNKCLRECSFAKKLTKPCQSCRFQKCLEAGMLEKMVFSRKAIYSVSNYEESILDELEEAYSKLEHGRNETFNPKSDSNPKFCSHEELNNTCTIDIQIIFDNLISYFQAKKPMGKEQDDVLKMHFIVPFVLFDTAFRAIGKSSYISPDGTMFGGSYVEKLYQDSSKSKIGINNGKTSQEIMESYWKVSYKILKSEMELLELDRSEFLLLSALIYWDFGLEHQTDECCENCNTIRKKVLKGLADYERKKSDESALRVATVMGLLQAVPKVLDVMKTCGFLSKIYNLRGDGCPLYAISTSSISSPQ